MLKECWSGFLVSTNLARFIQLGHLWISWQRRTESSFDYQKRRKLSVIPKDLIVCRTIFGWESSLQELDCKGSNRLTRGSSRFCPCSLFLGLWNKSYKQTHSKHFQLGCQILSLRQANPFLLREPKVVFRPRGEAGHPRWWKILRPREWRSSMPCGIYQAQ